MAAKNWKIDPMVLSDARFRVLYESRWQTPIGPQWADWPTQPARSLGYQVRLFRRQFFKIQQRLLPLLKVKRGARCVHCGRKRNLQLDHVLPITWGGTNDEFNLQLYCSRCNSANRNTLPIVNFDPEKEAVHA